MYVLSHPEESAIYWRVSRSYSSSKKQTTRQPDENGLFAIDFYCDGEIVTLQCKDQALVTAIDAEGTANPHFGFTFDDDGHISGIVKSALGIRGLLACESYDITEMGDTVTFDFEGFTDGVFQFESDGMKSVMRKFRPETLEDLIAIISLYRPGPMDSIPRYIHNRHNPKDVKYDTPLLRSRLLPQGRFPCKCIRSVPRKKKRSFFECLFPKSH